VQRCIGRLGLIRCLDRGSGAWLGHGWAGKTLLAVDGTHPPAASTQMLVIGSATARARQFSSKARPGDFATSPPMSVQAPQRAKASGGR